MRYFHADPRWMINNSGKPYTFIGQRGVIIIQMGGSIEATQIQIKSFGKEHSKDLKSTSPKVIDFYLSQDGVNYKKLTTYRYNNNGESMQTIKVDVTNETKFNYIKVQVNSNWGSNVTNIHSIKVFGKE
jgi:hypothetical protein